MIEHIEKQLKQDIKLYDSSSHYKDAIDLLQKDFKCCGLESYQDWKITMLNNVPDTCCKKIVKKCGQNFTKNAIYVKGCFEELEKDLNSHYSEATGIEVRVVK